MTRVLAMAPSAVLRTALRVVERVREELQSDLLWRGIAQRIADALDDDEDLDAFPLVNVKHAASRPES